MVANALSSLSNSSIPPPGGDALRAAAATAEAMRDLVNAVGVLREDAALVAKIRFPSSKDIELLRAIVRRPDPALVSGGPAGDGGADSSPGWDFDSFHPAEASGKGARPAVAQIAIRAREAVSLAIIQAPVWSEFREGVCRAARPYESRYLELLVARISKVLTVLSAVLILVSLFFVMFGAPVLAVLVIFFGWMAWSLLRKFLLSRAAATDLGADLIVAAASGMHDSMAAAFREYAGGNLSRDGLKARAHAIAEDFGRHVSDSAADAAPLAAKCLEQFSAAADRSLVALAAAERSRFVALAAAALAKLEGEVEALAARKGQAADAAFQAKSAALAAGDRVCLAIQSLSRHGLVLDRFCCESRERVRRISQSVLSDADALLMATNALVAFAGKFFSRGASDFTSSTLMRLGCAERSLDECNVGIAEACLRRCDDAARNLPTFESLLSGVADACSRTVIEAGHRASEGRDAATDWLWNRSAATCEIVVDRRRVELERLDREHSALFFGVQTALQSRHLSLAIAPPGGPAFSRMSRLEEKPDNFLNAHVLRYVHRDLLRLGSVPSPLPGGTGRSAPIFLHLQEDEGMPAVSLALAPIRKERSLVVRGATPTQAALADGLVRQLAMRTLGLRHPGLVQLTVIDPCGAGATFRELGSLQGLAFDRANLATDEQGISSMLRGMREEMTSMILASSARGDRTIDDSLANARQTSVPFRTLCVFGFPRGFDDRSFADLEQLCRAGDDAGIHVLVSLHDAEMLALIEASPNLAKRQPFKDAAAWITVDDPATRKAHLSIDGGARHGGSDLPFTLDPPFSPGEVALIVKSLTHDSQVKDSRRISPVEAAERLAATAGESANASREVTLVLGTETAESRSLATIPFGRDIAHHALLVGATGSGKTRLLQGIVASGCMRYRPDELQFWLLDFKSGTGFKPFAAAGVPHCRVVGLSSDVTYGLDALEKLIDEMNRRQILFKRTSVENLEQYADLRLRTGGSLKPLPRIVAVIDEFQTLFGRDTATMARIRMGQIVQKGRSAGIHLFLCTQSLEGQAGDIDSLRSQIKVNIVLQSSASTQRAVLDRDDYVEVQKLRRFEGLLDLNGRKTIFDVLDLPDSPSRVNPNLHDALVRARPAASGWPPALVYDGDAEVPLPSRDAFRTTSSRVRQVLRLEGVPIMLGTPAAVTELPAQAELRCAMNGNVVISTTNDRQVETQLAALILSIWAAEGVESVHVDVLQPDRMGQTWRSLARGFPPEVAIKEHDPSKVMHAIEAIAAEIPVRSPARRRLLLIREWTLLKAFADMDLGSTADAASAIVSVGPMGGVHVIAATSSGRRLSSFVRDYYSIRVASASSQEMHSAIGFNPSAIGRMFVEDPSRPDSCTEFLPYSFGPETTHD